MDDETLKLFNDVERTYSGVRGEAEPAFAFVNRSDRPLFAKARGLLQEWFDDMDADGNDKKDLLARFRSSDEKPHVAAFFELYCHGWLRHQGFEVKLHQSADENSSRVPDFSAHRSGERLFYLESTLAADTFMDDKARARLDAFLEGLAKLNSPHYGLSMDYDEGPQHQPSSKRAKRFLQDKLSRLEQASGASDPLPSGEGVEWEYDQGWKVRFSPMLRAAEVRGKPGQRLILSGVSGGEVNPEASLRASVKRKAAVYGDLSKPYVVAVDTADQNTWESDVLDALVGDVVYRMDPTTRRISRSRDSGSKAVFRGPRGEPSNTRVSGVLVAYNLHIGNLASSDTPELWHNPWAKIPLDPALWQGPQVFIDPDTFELTNRSGPNYQNHLRRRLDYRDPLT